MTFAGTPDRVESRLVPEAGFELDTFPVSGLPRRPSAAQLRAAWRASAAPMHCLRILARRRPDVVLGGGGFVAGPMVLAARLRRIPAALTEADAHLGLANRLAAPFARRLFLAYEIPGRDGAKVRVVGRPIPVAHMGASRGEGRAALRARSGRTRRRGLRRPRRRPVAQRARGVRLGSRPGRRCCTSAASATSTPSARASSATTTSCCRRPTTSARRSLRPISPCRGPAGPCGSSRPRARPRSSSPTRTRPPTTRRSTPVTSSEAGERSSCPTRTSIASRRSSTSCSPTRRVSPRCARRCVALARPDAADVIADELVALARGA